MLDRNNWNYLTVGKKSELRLILTVFDIEQYLHWTELFDIELFWLLTVCKQDLYLYLAELEQLD